MNIKAEIVADSINENGNRITTFLLTYPRIIHAELLTHRAFSRNAASSRAIPFKRMCEAIEENPFVPIAWQKDHKGMQGTEYFTNDDLSVNLLTENWLRARDNAIHVAEGLSNHGLTKQLVNRLLEPFQWYTSLVTATDFENFFELRCPQYAMDYKHNDEVKNTIYYRSKKDLIKAEDIKFPDSIDWFKMNKGAAEIHLMALAECMWDAMNENKPKELKEGEWHIPFSDKIDRDKVGDALYKLGSPFEWDQPGEDEYLLNANIAVSTGMSARTSYTVVGDEKEVKYETLIGIHDKMINQRPFHASPFEHCAQANDGRRSRNFVGFTQYREIVENGNE